MPRVYLTFEQKLFDKIENDANNNNITINLLLQNLCEKIYFSSLSYRDIIDKIASDTTSFDYADALEKLKSDVRKLPCGEFILDDLLSYRTLCIATAEKGYLQPSTLRPRLGKLFNSAVRNKNIYGVVRAKDKNDKLKFYCNAAVYMKITDKDEEQH